MALGITSQLLTAARAAAAEAAAAVSQDRWRQQQQQQRKHCKVQMNFVGSIHGALDRDNSGQQACCRGVSVVGAVCSTDGSSRRASS